MPISKESDNMTGFDPLDVNGGAPHYTQPHDTTAKEPYVPPFTEFNPPQSYEEKLAAVDAKLRETAVSRDTKDTNPKAAIGDTKVPLWLLSPIAKAHWALAQFLGLVKYGAWNWRIAGVRYSTYISAIDRHMDGLKSGEDYDPVDGTLHLSNVMACASIMLEARAVGKLTDDRPPVVPGMREAYAEVEKQMAVLKQKYAHLAPRHYTIADTEPVIGELRQERNIKEGRV